MDKDPIKIIKDKVVKRAEMLDDINDELERETKEMKKYKRN
jgi:hypothetical protein